MSYVDLPLNLVYLQPDQPGVPVDYIRSIEKAGMVALPQKYLAMYTMSGTPSIGPQGPQGPPGNDFNSWFDTIIAADAYHSEWDPLTVRAGVTTFRAPYPLDLSSGYIRASLTTAPQGAPVIIDVHMNGATVFSTPIYIDINTRTSVGSIVPSVLSVTAIPDDAEFVVHVLQIGTTEAGRGLKVAVTGIKTD